MVPRPVPWKPKRERFYAKNMVLTTSHRAGLCKCAADHGRHVAGLWRGQKPKHGFGAKNGFGWSIMALVWPSDIHPALRGLGLECRSVGVRLLAYAGGLLILAAIAADMISGLSHSAADLPANITPARKIWLEAVRPQPAFSVPMSEFDVNSNTYQILRHAEGGGRKDVSSWTDPNGALLGRLTIYRPGSEIDGFDEPARTLAQSAELSSTQTVQAAGVAATKFGWVPLFAFAREATPSKPEAPCLGFVTASKAPRLQISGWFCQGENLERAREFAACALDRLTMLSSGNDSQVAALFASAERQRGRCGSDGTLTGKSGANDWITGLNEPNLRGRIKEGG